jgi:hypothetical protein
MRDGDSVVEHLNAFNTMVSQLVSVEIKFLDEDKCIGLLCSLPDTECPSSAHGGLSLIGNYLLSLKTLEPFLVGYVICVPRHQTYR